ncbi:hypothetical protein F0U59_26475 [Archangium gephyra]|nr:hypothetical protein F0U59_26475 [Archangium gephyra]
MKKLPALIAAGVIGLSGCASNSVALSEGELPLEELMNETKVAKRSRANAPTVYNGEATGGAGHTVTTGDGQIWAPEIAPGNTVSRTQSDTWRGLQEDDVQSVIIDEGPTREASQ